MTGNPTTKQTGKQEKQTAPVTMQENQTAKEPEAQNVEIINEPAPDISKVQTQEIDTTLRLWLKGELKEEHMEELMKELYNYEFPGEAIQQTRHPTMKKDILGYNAQYIINALNQIIGVNHWREHGTMKEERPASAYVSIYHGFFEIGNWKEESIEIIEEGKTTKRKVREFIPLIQHSTYGGSRNMDQWESLKGAKTNFLKKISSYISLGWKSYALQLDEDFANVQNDNPDHKPKVKGGDNYNYDQTYTPPAPTTGKATPPAKKPAQEVPPEPPKPATEKQLEMINKLYEEYLGKVGTQAKTIPDLIKPYGKTTIKDLSLKQASQFIDQIKKHLDGLK